MGKFVIEKRTNGEYQFNLLAGNYEIILTSQGYSTKTNCKNGIESVRENSQIDSRFEKLISSNSKYYFNLKSSNGQVIGTSQMYLSIQARETGISSVKSNAPTAPIEDLTI